MSVRNSFVVMVLFLVVALGSVAGCDGTTDMGNTLDELEVSELDSKADSYSELKVRAGNTSLWITKDLQIRSQDENDVVVLSGRTSRNLTEVFGFVIDDPYGAAEILSARKFEVVWAFSEARSLLVGVNQFVRLTMVHSSSAADTIFARIVVRPKLVAFEGQGARLTAELKPVFVDGRIRFRVYGNTDSKLYSLMVLQGDKYLDRVRIKDDTHFELDLTDDEILSLLKSQTSLVFKVGLLSGVSEKKAKLSLAVKKLGLTTSDPYEKWPNATCSSSTLQCLTALPKDTLDLGSCAEALLVQACGGSIGVTISQAEVDAANQGAQNKLSQEPGFGADADALVGAERVTQLTTNLTERLRTRLNEFYWTWTLSPEASQKLLTQTVDEEVDHAYAAPLTLVTALTPIANDQTRIRNLVADELLHWISTHDPRGLEWSRPLVDLTRAHRTEHITSLRAFRQESVPSEWSPNPAWDNYTGNWLGALIEVRVEKTTGAVAEIMVEID